MSVDVIFGEWNSLPTSGYCDEISTLWNELSVQNPGTPEQRNNSGLTQRRAEITMLWDLYRRARPKVVTEIGVAQAGTFAAWCFLGRPDALIIGIDRDTNDSLPRGDQQVSPKLVPKRVTKMTEQGGGLHAYGRHNQRTVAINGWSTDPKTLSQLNAVLGGRKIDWLWNDASHDAENTMKDWEAYWPLVAPGGVYAMHDIMPSTHPDCNRSEAYEKIKATADYSALFEFRGSRTDDSMGVAAFVKI